LPEVSGQTLESGILDKRVVKRRATRLRLFSFLKARVKHLIAAVNRCATQKQASTSDFVLSLPTIFFILLRDEWIRHTRDVVANHPGQRVGFLAVTTRQVLRFFHPVGEELAYDALGIFFFALERRAEIEILVEKILQLTALLFYFGAESGEALGIPANIFRRMNTSAVNPGSGMGNQVAHQLVEDTLQGFVELQFFGGSGIETASLGVMAGEDRRTFRDLLH
jgi:hypothetical protein